MTTKTKPVEGWVVIDGNDGELIHSTFGELQEDSVKLLLEIFEGTDYTWKELRKEGYRAVRATLKVNE